MKAEVFKKHLSDELSKLSRTLATESGDWVVKGFIDIYKNIYTISIDTKVISKIIELMLFPVLLAFGKKHKYKLVLSEHQNHYPDITFITHDNTKFAVDLKSTYRKGPNSVNGFTLGAFTGYFRNRASSKNTTFPYREYSAHLVLGIIYSRNEDRIDERKKYTIKDLQAIASAIGQFQFLLQDKWRIAAHRPGSGNTKNIGSITNIEKLVLGDGPFAEYGENVFDDYWMNYLTADMARAIESIIPYSNLKEYWQWKKRGKTKNSRRSK